MEKNRDKWIMRPFNALFFAMLTVFTVILVVVSAALRSADDMTKRVILACVCLFTTVIFFIYKYYLSIDKEYDIIRDEMGMGGFNWWGELPLHLCNINMMLIPIAVLLKIRPLESFCFFAAPLGAMAALAMPGYGFEGYSIILPRMLGFFGTHFMIFIEGLAITTFKLYKPAFSDIPLTLLTALITLLGVSAINLILRWTEVYPNANYFYSIETEDNVILDMFYRWLPVPVLYIMPCIGILAFYMFVITSIFHISDVLRLR